MNKVQLHAMNKSGIFFIEEDGEKIAYMTFRLSNENQLIVDHTIVTPEYEGQGYAKALLTAMLDYLRTNRLQLIPLCSFVQEQLENHPEYLQSIEDIENE